MQLGTAPAVVLIDISCFDNEETIALVRMQACTRTMAEVALPPPVRLVKTILRAF